MGKKHGQFPEGNTADPIADMNDNIFVFCLITLNDTQDITWKDSYFLNWLHQEVISN